jgi:hypothetical protein
MISFLIFSFFPDGIRLSGDGESSLSTVMSDDPSHTELGIGDNITESFRYWEEVWTFWIEVSIDLTLLNRIMKG